MHLNDEAKIIFAKESVVDSAINLFSLISWEKKKLRNLDSLEILVSPGGVARQTFFIKLEEALTRMKDHKDFKGIFEWRKKNNLTKKPENPDESMITIEFKRFKRLLTDLLILLNRKQFRMAFTSIYSGEDTEEIVRNYKTEVTEEELAEMNELIIFVNFIYLVNSEAFWRKVFNAIGK